MRTVNVSLGSRSYPIFIGSNLLPKIGGECAKLKLAGRCAVISDRNVAALYAKAVVASLEAAGFDPILITVPAGETSKSLQTVQRCYDQLACHRIERKSFIIALGGGVVGDLRVELPDVFFDHEALGRVAVRAVERDRVIVWSGILWCGSGHIVRIPSLVFYRLGPRAVDAVRVPLFWP